jgi:uncharacterized protein (TIGR00725 family)
VTLGRDPRPHELRGGSVEGPSPGSNDAAASPDRARARQVAVIGASGVEQGSEVARLGEVVGRLLAEAGVTVVCGAGPGVMEAAARGATEAGGRVIGIVRGTEIGEANSYCTEVVATGIGQARNLAVVASGEVVIAVGGEWGTLSEIALARTIGRTVVTLSSWGLVGREAMEGAPGVVPAETAEQAVALALAAL